MDREYKSKTPSKSIALIGDNHILGRTNANFKRFSNFKTNTYTTIEKLIYQCDYILDCTFNNESQDRALAHADKYDIEKIILLTNKSRNIKKYDKLVVIQLIVTDIYGEEHISFDREGAGNAEDCEIGQNSLICEAIRRIHESKLNCVPITYIPYPEDNIKFMYVDNIYRSVEYAFKALSTNSYYEIVDEEKSIGQVLGTIKDVLDYSGQIIHNHTEQSSKPTYRVLDDKHYAKTLDYNIRKIYKFITYTNERFIL